MNAAVQDISCPLVSIVVPVWGAEKFLPACLDSILNQTMPNWECILVDDGSQDNSGNICDEYAARDSRFVVIHKENGGVCAARNTGMDVAKGRYMMFLDDEDHLHPYLLEWAVDAMRTVPEGFVCWRYTRNLQTFNTGNEKGEWKCYSLDTSYFTRVTLYWAPWNKLYNREKVKKSGVRFDEEWYSRNGTTGEDEDFQNRLWGKWCAEGEVPICMMDEPLYFWNPGNKESLSNRMPAQRNQRKAKWQMGYWNKIYPEMARHQMLYPDSDHAWPWDLKIMRGTYLKQLAYALSSAKANGEKTPPLGHCKELTALLNSCKAEKTWSPYYLPFRLRQKWLVRFLYRLDDSENRNFGRFDWGFYYLLGGKWNR